MGYIILNDLLLALCHGILIYTVVELILQTSNDKYFKGGKYSGYLRKQFLILPT